MIALYRTLGADYLRVLEATGGNHRLLVRHELASLDTQHPDIGALLAQRWRLPDELVLPIKYHERPTAAPNSCCALIRCVALGNLFHDTITDADAVPALRRLYKLAREWFRLEPSRIDTLLPRVTEAAAELGRMLRLETGDFPNADSIVREAGERMTELAAAHAPHGADAEPSSRGSSAEHGMDPLPGVQSADSFDRSLCEAYEHAVRNRAPLSLLRLGIAGLDALAQDVGSVAVDEVVLNVLRRAFVHLGATIARLERGEFAVILPGTPRPAAFRGAELVASLLAAGVPGSEGRPLSVAIGMATIDDNSARSIRSSQAFLRVATEEKEATRSADNASRVRSNQARAA